MAARSRGRRGADPARPARQCSFITIEDETGIATGLLWTRDMENAPR
jgi:hypothetical protein